jgi:hypothetical protein
MKKVLVIHYSQSGQLTEIVQSITGPLRESEQIEIIWEELQPANPYPFPWPFFKFLNVFPESVLMEAPEMKPFLFNPRDRFDLIILGYTVWYLAPSLPVTGFLKSQEAEVMNNVPIITVVNCRDKWLMAQEKVKEHIEKSGGKLIDNIVLVHQGNALVTLVTTLRWLWAGKKKAFWNIFPSAGVNQKEIRDAERFGIAIRHALHTDKLTGGESLLKGLGAVKVDPSIIQQERAAHRHFLIWGKILSTLGKQDERLRFSALILFMLFLGCLVLISLPLTVIFQFIINPIRKNSLQKEVEFYEKPSGSSTEKL